MSARAWKFKRFVQNSCLQPTYFVCSALLLSTVRKNAGRRKLAECEERLKQPRLPSRSQRSVDGERVWRAPENGAGEPCKTAERTLEIVGTTPTSRTRAHTYTGKKSSQDTTRKRITARPTRPRRSFARRREICTCARRVFARANEGDCSPRQQPVSVPLVEGQSIQWCHGQEEETELWDVI